MNETIITTGSGTKTNSQTLKNNAPPPQPACQHASTPPAQTQENHHMTPTATMATMTNADILSLLTATTMPDGSIQHFYKDNTMSLEEFLMIFSDENDLERRAMLARVYAEVGTQQEKDLVFGTEIYDGRTGKIIGHEPR